MLDILPVQGNAKAVLKAYLIPYLALHEERGWALQKRGSTFFAESQAHCSALEIGVKRKGVAIAGHPRMIYHLVSIMMIGVAEVSPALS